MNPERWQRIKQLVGEAMVLDAGARTSYLQSSCEGDSDLHREVQSLLSSHELAGTGFLREPAVDFHPTTESLHSPHERIGPYGIIGEIGRGGMGEVYRAVRADGQYTKEVAIKLMQSGSVALLERFRHERQILASLDHFNIARLLDGGTTDRGVPYLVMELIEGIRIDDYCNQHRLSIAERLHLFLQVCDAVQFAHQRLIIHRDIKPGNILVTEEGVPKLLDFGIAKILEEGGGVSRAQATLTLFNLLTPQYASPEQIRGESITTASDVYSLGVVLYELLTGRSPYPRKTNTAHDAARAACEFEPIRPSILLRPGGADPDKFPPHDPAQAALGTPDKLAKLLSGDLDNIVLKALRKEPDRRYATVEQFAEDIRRHLANLPVQARRDTVRYRASKFVMRHKAGVTAAAMIGVMLAAGLIITVREARIAQRRFNDVRSLANSLIFDVHDSIKELPGSTPARKIIVDRSLQYLNVLAKESRGDAGLQRELATAYEKVGSVQGDYLENNLGDSAGTLVSYQKGLELRKQIDAASNDWKDRLALAQAYRLVAHQQWAVGKLQDARENIASAIATSEALDRTHPGNPKILYEMGFDHQVSAMIGYPGDALSNQKIIEDYRRAIAADDASLKLQPNDIRTLHGYAVDLRYTGDLVERTDPQGALPYYEKALEINRSLTQRSPEIQYARSMAISYANIADVYGDLGDFVREVENNRKGLKIYEDLSRADPRNALLRQGFAIAYVNTASALARVGNFADSLEYSGKGLEIMQSLVKSAPQNTAQRGIYAAMLVARGTILVKAKKTASAIGELSSARSIYEELAKSSPDDRISVAACDVKLGEAEAANGREQRADDHFRQALAVVEPLIGASDADLDALYVAADAYSGLGDLSAKRAGGQRASAGKTEWIAARAFYQQSLGAWRRIEHPNRTAPNSFEVGDPTAVARKLNISENELRAVRQ